jgi:hypothetical protein
MRHLEVFGVDLIGARFLERCDTPRDCAIHRRSARDTAANLVR